MDASKLRYELMRDLYQTQRDRREHIRHSVATPVAALAFSVFNLGTLSLNYRVDHWTDPVDFTIGVLMLLSVVCLISGALFIIRMERDVVYLDPPDLEELVDAEQRIRCSPASRDGDLEKQMTDLLTGSFDIVYRRSFAANERAARDRTRGLHLILVALILLVTAYALLPFQLETAPQ